MKVKKRNIKQKEFYMTSPEINFIGVSFENAKILNLLFQEIELFSKKTRKILETYQLYLGDDEIYDLLRLIRLSLNHKHNHISGEELYESAETQYHKFLKNFSK